MGVITVERVSGNMAVECDRMAATAKTALFETATWAAAQMQEQCRSNIASSGKFHGQWIEGLVAQVVPHGDDAIITVTHSMGQKIRPHAYGATIFGKPLLWIPFEFAFEAKNIKAKEYPGRMVRVNRRKGPPPILISIDDKMPKYFGKEQVTIPKRWNLWGICREICNKLAERYAITWKVGGP